MHLWSQRPRKACKTGWCNTPLTNSDFDFSVLGGGVGESSAILGSAGEREFYQNEQQQEEDQELEQEDYLNVMLI